MIFLQISKKSIQNKYLVPLLFSEFTNNLHDVFAWPKLNVYLCVAYLITNSWKCIYLTSNAYQMTNIVCSRARPYVTWYNIPHNNCTSICYQNLIQLNSILFHSNILNILYDVPISIYIYLYHITMYIRSKILHKCALDLDCLEVYPWTLYPYTFYNIAAVNS